MEFFFEHRKYGIGEHRETYTINYEFLEENEDIKGAEIQIDTVASVKSNSVLFNFKIKGTINIMCDVCLDYFDYEVETEKIFHVKFSDRYEFGQENLDENNTLTLSKSTEKIELTRHFYDFIMLSLPIKRVHPLDENQQRTCNPDFLKKLDELQTQTKTIDPRWDKLKQLLN